MPPEEIERHAGILDNSRDRAEIVRAARALAASETPAALLALGLRLRRAEFLDRLDDTSQPGPDIENLSFVFAELVFHPSPASSRLCELLYGEPEFRAIPVRVNLLLGALAAVVPTTEAGAQVFRDSNAEGFAEVNGPLLIENQSPLAIQVFEELIAGSLVEADVKVEILHRSVLPKRTDIPVLGACMRLLDRGLPAEVRDGLIETLFDYQSRLWFGPVRQAPTPPPWDSASTEVLRLFVVLADHLESRGLREPLLSSVRATRERIAAILMRRQQ